MRRHVSRIVIASLLAAGLGVVVWQCRAVPATPPRASSARDARLTRTLATTWPGAPGPTPPPIELAAAPTLRISPPVQYEPVLPAWVVRLASQHVASEP